MRRARLFVTGIGALILAGCPSAFAPHQVGVGGGGGANRALFFQIQPPDTVVASVAFETRVAVRDTVLGIIDTTATGAVTIALGSAPAGGQLSGTLSIVLVSGVAIFSDLALTPSGSYTLKASSTGLTTITSNTIVVTP
jgi:hypothetical protein